jgi:hypothetical protein
MENQTSRIRKHAPYEPVDVQTSHMAWRIEEQVVRWEIDNRTPNREVGKIWLVGRD